MCGAKADSKSMSDVLGIDLSREYLDDGWKPAEDNLFADLFVVAVRNFDLSSDPKRVVASLETIGKLMSKKFNKVCTMGELEAKLNQLRIRHKAFKYWRTIPGVIFDEINYQACATDTYWTKVDKNNEPPLFFHFRNNCCFLETRLHRIFDWPGVVFIPSQVSGTSNQPIVINETAGASTSVVVPPLGATFTAPIMIMDDEVDLVAVHKEADILNGGHKMVFYTCDASGRNIRPVDDHDSLFLHKYRKSESDNEDDPGFPEDAFPEDTFPGPGGFIVPDTP